MCWPYGEIGKKMINSRKKGSILYIMGMCLVLGSIALALYISLELLLSLALLLSDSWSTLAHCLTYPGGLRHGG